MDNGEIWQTSHSAEPKRRRHSLTGE